MKNKVLTGVYLVAGVFGVVAPALLQAQEAAGNWYETREQRCQTILNQKNLDESLKSELQACQNLPKSGAKPSSEEVQQQAEQEDAVKQLQKAMASTPERLKNMSDVKLDNSWQSDFEKIRNQQFPEQSK